MTTIKDELVRDHRFDGVKESLNAIARDVSCPDNRLENIYEGVADLNSDLSDIKDWVENISSALDDKRVYRAEILGNLHEESLDKPTSIDELVERLKKRNFNEDDIAGS